MKCVKQLTKGLLMLSLIGLLGGCAAGNVSDVTNADGSAIVSTKKGKKVKKEAYNPVGEWQYSVEAVGGDNSGKMTIVGTPGTYEIILKTGQFGEMRVYDLDMTGQSMSGKIDIGGTTAEVEGDFDEDYFSGAWVIGDNVYPMEATRTSKD